MALLLVGGPGNVFTFQRVYLEPCFLEITRNLQLLYDVALHIWLVWNSGGGSGNKIIIINELHERSGLLAIISRVSGTHGQKVFQHCDRYEEEAELKLVVEKVLILLMLL